MTPIRAIALLSISLTASLAACQPTVDNVARDGAVCDPFVPAPVVWDGKSLPSFQSLSPAIYLFDHPKNHKWLRALLVDDSKIVSVLDLAGTAVGQMLALAIVPCPPAESAGAQPAQDDPRCSLPLHVVKIPPGMRPGSGGVPELAVNLTPLLHSDYLQISDELASGQLCPGK
jgi:hypothetical protein